MYPKFRPHCLNVVSENQSILDNDERIKHHSFVHRYLTWCRWTLVSSVLSPSSSSHLYSTDGARHPDKLNAPSQSTVCSLDWIFHVFFEFTDVDDLKLFPNFSPAPVFFWSFPNWANFIPLEVWWEGLENITSGKISFDWFPIADHHQINIDIYLFPSPS